MEEHSMKTKRIKFGLNFAFFLLPILSFADKPLITELVQTTPSETKLSEPGIREAKDVWLELVQNAKSTIDIEQMYILNDVNRELEPILKALEKASDRGVKIRVILSSQMLNNDPAAVERLKKIKNLSLQTIDLSKLTSGIQHAKFWIVDKEKVFVGSQNLDWKAISEIHELGILIQNKNVADRLQTIFETDLKIGQTNKIPSDSEKLVAPLTDTQDLEMLAVPATLNPKNINDSLPSLLGLLKSAKKRIQIQVMDFSTFTSKEGNWMVLSDALKEAGARGVDVQFVVSHWNQEKPEINSIKALSTMKNIQMKICEIPMLSSGFMPYARVIHSKYVIIDDQTLWLSTSNWSKGYFLYTRGIDFILKDPKLISGAGNIFNRIWTAPYTQFVDAKKDYPLPRKGQ